MSFSKMAWALFALCWLSAVLALSAYHWRSSYLHEKQKSESAVTLAEQRQQIITGMQQRQREVAALDAKYTQELSEAGIQPDDSCLEPSAGTGNLAALMPTDQTQCVEISALHCRVLEAKGLTVEQADFIQWAEATSSRFDKVVMNPPFSEG